MSIYTLLALGWVAEELAGQGKAVLTLLGEEHLAAHLRQASERRSTFPRSCGQYRWHVCAINCCRTHQVRGCWEQVGCESLPPSPSLLECLKNRRLKNGMCPKAIASWQGDWPRGRQVLPDSATKDFLPLEAAGRISQPFTKQAEIRRPKLFLPCFSSQQGEQTWESTPKVSSREKALEISPGAEFFIDWLKTNHEQRQD